MEFTENEITQLGDQNCGKSQYRSSEIVKKARQTVLQFYNGIGSV
jgi:hypothetical protein